MGRILVKKQYFKPCTFFKKLSIYQNKLCEGCETTVAYSKLVNKFIYKLVFLKKPHKENSKSGTVVENGTF